jgi:hypothetical protein
MPICPACRGQKKIQGMGSMGEVDCKTCKGTGLEPVEVKTLEIKTDVIKAPESDKITVMSVEVLELEVEEEKVDPVKSHETMTERLKRKYTKSAK